MRILYHHRTQGEEPESIHIRSIVEALSELGHTVLVVGPNPVHQLDKGRTRPTILGRIKRHAPQVIFELMQIFYNIVVYRRLAKAIKEFNPELIYERYALFNFAGVRLAKRLGIPFILEVNTPYAQAWAKYYGLYLKSLARWLEKKILLTADHLITVTKVQLNLLVKEGIPTENITVCHNAIDPAGFCSNSDHAVPRRKEMGLATVVVGFVGTMNRWQGITEFPTVLRHVFDRCDGVSFLFVGDGEFRQFLEDFCATSGYMNRVRFTRRQPHAEIPGLIAMMDITVLLNSNAYGSPMKIFEYMGMGKAVIAPAVAPVVEVIRDGDTGLLIEPGNAVQMAEQIIRLVQDPLLRERLGAAGRAYVTTHHTWRQNVITIEDIYRKIVQSRSMQTEQC